MRTQGTIWQRENDGRNCSTCTQTTHAITFFIKSDNNRENDVLWECNSSLRSTYYQKCKCALLHKTFVTFTSSVPCYVLLCYAQAAGPRTQRSVWWTTCWVRSATTNWSDRLSTKVSRSPSPYRCRCLSSSVWWVCFHFETHTVSGQLLW